MGRDRAMHWRQRWSSGLPASQPQKATDFGKAWPHQPLEFGLLSLQNCEPINSSCLSQPVCVLCYKSLSKLRQAPHTGAVSWPDSPRRQQRPAQLAPSVGRAPCGQHLAGHGTVTNFGGTEAHPHRCHLRELGLGWCSSLLATGMQ